MKENVSVNKRATEKRQRIARQRIGSAAEIAL